MWTLGETTDPQFRKKWEARPPPTEKIAAPEPFAEAREAGINEVGVRTTPHNGRNGEMPQGVADNATARSENRPIKSPRRGKYRPDSRINDQALRDIANSWLAPRPRYQGTTRP
jgi:hypothetical protein